MARTSSLCPDSVWRQMHVSMSWCRHEQSSVKHACCHFLIPVILHACKRMHVVAGGLLRGVQH
jgi:hypothetical protein